jgi:hypothetical protein
MLLSPLIPAGDVILHNRGAAREAVLVPETLEDPLLRMLLVPRRDLSSKRMRSITGMKGSSFDLAGGFMRT